MTLAATPPTTTPTKTTTTVETPATFTEVEERENAERKKRNGTLPPCKETGIMRRIGTTTTTMTTLAVMILREAVVLVVGDHRGSVAGASVPIGSWDPRVRCEGS